MDSTIYDLCIVGAGMFGSAAARHASANAGIKICLVGPKEPKTDQEKSQREIFAAHYDEGRITRVLDTSISCQILSRESIKRYRKLEELSGIKFYSPVGLLYVEKKLSEDLENLKQSANALDLPVVDLSYGDIFKKRYPYIKLIDDDYPLLEDIGSGHISPRKMIAAQKEVAKCQGCDVISKVVEEVKPLEDGIHEIITEDKQIIKAKRVLICTGAFTNLKKFPMPKLLMTIHKGSAALLKIPEKEAERLSAMPSIIYKGKENAVYVLPPIKYPDGNYYLKIGDSSVDDGKVVETLKDIKLWYLSGGDQEKTETLTNILTHMIPGLQYTESKGMTCVTSYTNSGLPYIDRVTPTITVAAVANGKGAKFSDEVGRIAANLSLSGKWDSELPESNFRIMYEN